MSYASDAWWICFILVPDLRFLRLTVQTVKYLWFRITLSVGSLLTTGLNTDYEFE